MATSKRESVLRKVRALLAKAEDPAATPAEAEAFSAKAEALIAQYAIDLALLDSRKREENRGRPVTKQVPMEAPYKIPKMQLLAQIATAMDVRLVTTGRKYGTLVGFESDLEAVDLLYTSLLLQMGNALREARQNSGKRGEDLVAFSQSFIQGFASVVGQRLRETRKSAVEATGEKAALALRDRSQVVDEALAEFFPYLKKGKASRITDYDGWARGGTEGRKADIGGSRVDGGSRSALSA